MPARATTVPVGAGAAQVTEASSGVADRPTVRLPIEAARVGEETGAGTQEGP